MIFRNTAAATDGQVVLVETIVKPGGFVAAAHVHSRQTEGFEVPVGFRIGGERLVADPGDRPTVIPGMPHHFWKPGRPERRLALTVHPALRFESLMLGRLFGRPAALRGSP